MSVFAVVQARMSSSRFPGKVLALLDGRPIVPFMFDRLARADLVDEVVLATSDHASDDPLAAAVTAAGFRVVRGPLDDVLGRYNKAATELGAGPGDAILRLTGDCPLIDPGVIDRLVALQAETGADYASNIDPPTFPDGFDCEIFTYEALVRAVREATTAFEREHVTPWMRDSAAGLSRVNLTHETDVSHMRLTVDHPDDLAAVAQVVAHVGAAAPLAQILATLEAHPEIMAVNPHARNEGSSAP